MPQGIISDRNSKFLSSFWKQIFDKLGIDMLTSTAYYPQTDSQSERINRTIEIALRFHITATGDDNWLPALPYIQSLLNNAKNQTTGFASNKLLYGFCVRDTLGMLADIPPEDYTKLRQYKRE